MVRQTDGWVVGVYYQAMREESAAFLTGCRGYSTIRWSDPEVTTQTCLFICVIRFRQCERRCDEDPCCRGFGFIRDTKASMSHHGNKRPHSFQDIDADEKLMYCMLTMYVYVCVFVCQMCCVCL